jgi:hypothetical protein
MSRNDFSKGEFMKFMDEFLMAHPEVVKDQQRGWEIYWTPTKDHPESVAVPRMPTRTK